MRRLYKYKRAGRWYARQVLPDGTTKNYPLGVTEKEGVRKAEKALQLLQEKMEFQTHSASTLPEMVAQFLESKRDRVRPSTLSLYTHWLTGFSEFCGEVDPFSLSISQVEKWQRHLLKTLSPTTVNIASNSLKSLLSWGSERGMCKPLNVSTVRVKKKVFNTLTFEEFESKVVPHVTSDRLILAFSLFMYTGLRRGEATRLLWTDVHLGTNRIFVRSDEKGQTKSGQSRWVPIHPVLHTRLQRATRTGPYVLQGKSGQPYGDALMRRWGETMKRAGLEHMRLHDLRGSYATELLKSHTPAIVQKILGHKDISTTMRYYSRLTSDDAASAVSTLFSTLSPP